MSEIIYGRRPVLESLRATRRQASQLVLAQGIKESGVVEQIVQLAADLSLPVQHLSRQQLDERTQGANHQGVLLSTQAYPYVDLQDILTQAGNQGQQPFILLLDLLQDVQNVGTLLRTADAVGVHGVVLQDRRGAKISPAVVRASSGAVEHLRVAQVTNLVRAMESLRQADVWLAGLDGSPDATPFYQADLAGGIGLVVGGEGRGLRRLVRQSCDFLISLPMRGQIESLNAATAGSVALYAVWQARGFA